jgi:hypothetical protein
VFAVGCAAVEVVVEVVMAAADDVAADVAAAAIAAAAAALRLASVVVAAAAAAEQFVSVVQYSTNEIAVSQSDQTKRWYAPVHAACFSTVGVAVATGNLVFAPPNILRVRYLGLVTGS